MKSFLRGCLLFLQCLVTWPWAMPLALFVLTVEGFNYRRVGGRFTDIWKIAFGAGRADWRRSQGSQQGPFSFCLSQPKHAV